MSKHSHQTREHALRFALVISALLIPSGSPATAGETPPAADFDPQAPLQSRCVAAVIVARGSALDRFELESELTRDGASRVRLRQAPIGVDADSTVSAATIDLWEGAWSMPAIESRLALGSTSSGAWVLAATAHTGSSRAILLWSSGASAPSTPPSPLGRGWVRQVTIAGAGDLGGSVVLDDVHSPQVFEWRGGLRVIGAGLGSGRLRLANQNRLWTAPLATRDGAPNLDGLAAGELAGSLCGDGTDPRVVVVGDEVLVFARQPATYLQAVGDAALQVMRSRDLVNWTIEPALVPPLLVGSGYDVASIGGRIHVATAVDSDRVARVVRFDERTGVWERVGETGDARLSLPTSREDLWLLEAADGRVALAARDLSARWTVRRP